MGRNTVWHERDEFWDTFQESIFPPDSFETAERQVAELVELLEIEPPARILDIPCGVGRHAIPLAEQGYDVTGVDRTEDYLDTARDRLGTADGEIEFRCDDMRNFSEPGSFDVALNLYTSFGYFAEREDDIRTAQNFYDSLREGGRLAMSLTSKEILAGKFEPHSWHEEDGQYHLEEREITDGWSWLENRWIIVDNGQTAEFDVSHRLYSGYELSQLLNRVGFDDVSLYGSFEGAAFDNDAERLLVIGTK